MEEEAWVEGMSQVTWPGSGAQVEGLPLAPDAGAASRKLLFWTWLRNAALETGPVVLIFQSRTE